MTTTVKDRIKRMKESHERLQSRTAATPTAKVEVSPMGDKPPATSSAIKFKTQLAEIAAVKVKEAEAQVEQHVHTTEDLSAEYEAEKNPARKAILWAAWKESAGIGGPPQSTNPQYAALTPDTLHDLYSQSKDAATRADIWLALKPKMGILN